MVLLWVASVATVAQSAPSEQQRAAVIEFAKKAAVAALNFDAGDRQSLIRAQDDFSPEGWSEHLKTQSGYLDEHGAPTYNSRFVPSGGAVVMGEEGDSMRIRIPGTLTQSTKIARTDYRHAGIDVTVGGKPLKIRRLQTIFMLRISR
jgi:hypothetical protein